MNSRSTQTTPLNRNTIRFLLDGELHEVVDIDPTTTLLNYLREKLHKTGTKEGCAEGDCGACTVVVAELNGEQLQFCSINACIQFLPGIDGKALMTVESLKLASNGKLHPVQQALVDCHGSQCGFCTPGFVMSLFTLYKSQLNPTRKDIDDALAGNLCRCTGYRPIIDAAAKMYEYGEKLAASERNLMTTAGAVNSHADELINSLQEIRPAGCLQIENSTQYFAPTELDELAELVKALPDATMLAGGTDVGLWVTKQYRELATIIYIGNVAALHRIAENDTYLEIAAAVSLTDAFTPLLKHYPHLDEIARRFASPPIRNVGTLCGNLVTGSPIGDCIPALISLDAKLLLRRGNNVRELALDMFYLGYQQKALNKGEFLEAVRIPLPQANQQFHSYKVSKRFDQDISAVCGAYSLHLDNQRVKHIRICYGGMAATAKRAAHCEATIVGQPWNESTVDSAIQALSKDYQPLSDMRATADYRSLVAANLLRRFYYQTTAANTATSVFHYAS